MQQYFTIFSSKIGWCAISWSNSKINNIVLAHKNKQHLISRMSDNSLQKKPPKWINSITQKMQTHLEGKFQDFSNVPLDYTGISVFRKQVYQFTKRVVSVITYGEIAKKIGRPNAFRAVGSAMKKNPFSLVVPCHRVLAAGYKLGGFSSEGGIKTKVKILAIEGYELDINKKPTRKNSSKYKNYEAMNFLMQRDRKLAKYIKKIGPFNMSNNLSPNTFVSLLKSIIYQQLTEKSASVILKNVLTLFPNQEFPKPENLIKITEKELRNAGLSRNKVKSVKDLAQKTIDNEIPSLKQLEEMENEKIITILTKVKGIGRWTVEMLLMSTLKRMDILPSTDYGVQKGFALVYETKELPSPKELSEYGKNWKPYRTAASWYLWRSLELES